MDKVQRAYSCIEVKAVNEDRRVVRGIATTPGVDRVGDIVEPLGVSFKNPLAFLWQHRHDQPIGQVRFEAPTEGGIEFEAEVAHTDEPGTLKDRLDEAWQSIKLGLVRAVSIGFRPVEYAFMDDGGIRFIKSEVFELSAVTIPANEQAIISSVGKSMDAETASFIKQFDQIQPEPAPAAASGKKQVRVVRLNGPARDRAKPFVIRSIKR